MTKIHPVQLLNLSFLPFWGLGHANTYAPIIKGANSWRNVTSPIFVFINMINKTACQFCLSLGDFPQVAEHMVLLFFVRHCSFVLFWSWIAFCLLFPLFYVIRSPILTEGTEFRCGGAYNANDYFFQFKALHSRKNRCKNIAVPWNSCRRRLAQNGWIIFEKYWKTLHGYMAGFRAF